MALIELEISKSWWTSTTIRETNWDNIRVPLVEWADNTNRNLEQICKDAFGTSYELDNDGNANNSTALINAMATLSEDETVTGSWTFSGITYFNSTKLRIKGAGAGIATLTNANTANSRTITIPDTGANSGMLLDEHFPIGSFLLWSDYNATLSFPNTTIWHCCDGQAINDASSSLNGITPLDMTGRYFVGFTTGAEGDGSIDLAGNTNAAAVGNAAHQVNLAHTHTGPSHSHTGATGSGGTGATGAPSTDSTDSSGSGTSGSGGTGATGNAGSHYHAGTGGSGGNFEVSAPGSYSDTVADHSHTGPDHTHTTPNHSHTLSAHTHTGPSHTHSIGADGTGATGSGGSATQTIQPRSVQCRVFVRKR